MRIDHLLRETAIVTKRTPTGARDDYGNVLVAPTTRTVGCWHQQTTSSIPRTEQGPVAETTWDAWFPPGDPISHTDQVTIGGVAYEVIGAPWQSTNPRTGESWQVEATLRRTDG